jgi:hypothetical protein
MALMSMALGSLAACAGHSDALARGQRYYEDNQYERALALWRDLDRREAAFAPRERARYAYFRGMTDYRLGFRDDARHWLAIAKAADARLPGALGPSWLERLEGALTDLGREALGLRPDGSDVIQTIELAPGFEPPDATSGESSSGQTAPLERAPAGDSVTAPATGEAATPDDTAAENTAADGEPLPTDSSAGPSPAPRR